MKIQRFLLQIILCLSLLLTACNLPMPGQAVTTPGLSALEISASQTAATGPSTTILPPLPSETAGPPTISETPRETSIPSQTPSPSPEPSATPTATLGPLLARVTKETNCRKGPGSMYERIATYQADTQLEVLAKDLGGGYWFVGNPVNPDEKCWVIGSNLKIEQEKTALTALPAFTPPHTPTAAPYFEVTFKNYDQCKGQYFLRFVVVNTGGYQFRSGYVRVKDTKRNITVESSFNAFDLTTGCIIAKNIAPLGPGETGYLQSGYFKYDPRANNLNAVVMACVEKNLQPPCVTQTLVIKNK